MRVDWIDLNAPAPCISRQLRRALCESRIARAASGAVGVIARSGFAKRVGGVFTPDVVDTVCLLTVMAACYVSGMLTVALIDYLKAGAPQW